MIYPRFRAVLFIRVNRRFVSHRLLAAKSIERQRELGEYVARQLQASVVREYVDLSGAVRLGRRPELQALLMSLKHYPVQYVIVEDWSTLSNDPDDSAAILSEITETGAELVVGDGKFGEDGPVEDDSPGDHEEPEAA